MEVSQILNDFYWINIHSFKFLERQDLNYAKNLSRSVSTVGEDKILKILYHSQISHLNEIFRVLEENKVENIIFPIKNIFWNFVSDSNKESYLLFDRFELLPITYADLWAIITSFWDFTRVLSLIPRQHLYNNYINDVHYLLTLTQKLSFFDFLLVSLDIDKILFYDTLLYYYSEVQKKTLTPIYSSFWYGNIFTSSWKIYFLDLDSIKLWDNFFDLVSVLNLAYSFSPDWREKYRYYWEILEIFGIDDVSSLDKEFFRWLLYYYSFNIIRSLRDRDPKILLRDIKKSLDFSNDLFAYLAL